MSTLDAPGDQPTSGSGNNPAETLGNIATLNGW
jgi:hypothetical protein